MKLIKKLKKNEIQKKEEPEKKLSTEITKTPLDKMRIGDFCVVQERSKISDGGYYVGYIAGFESTPVTHDTVVYITVDRDMLDGTPLMSNTFAHCVYTSKTSIKEFMNKLDNEVNRLNVNLDKLSTKFTNEYEHVQKLVKEPEQYKMFWEKYCKNKADAGKKLKTEKDANTVKELKKIYESSYDTNKMKEAVQHSELLVKYSKEIVDLDNALEDIMNFQSNVEELLEENNVNFTDENN